MNKEPWFKYEKKGKEHIVEYRYKNLSKEDILIHFTGKTKNEALKKAREYRKGSYWK